jgi:hypothetical protein
MAVQLKGKEFSVSDQGLVAFVIKYYCDSEDEALFSTPSTYRGLPRQGRNGAEWDASSDKWIVTVTYQGLTGTEPGEDQDDYSIDAEFREEPIEAFPERDLLIKTYGGYIEEGRLKFPETLDSVKGNTSGLGNGKKTGAKNPLFGLTSYPVMRLVASHTMVRRTVPASVWREVGTVVKSLPSGFDEPGGKTWLVDAPIIRKKGNAKTITRRWKDIDKLNHLNALYLLLKK